MLTSLAYIFLLGLFFATLCQKLKLPRIIGMIAAELILFVLVGAAVDIRYTLRAGIPAIILIFIALFFRALGVLLCLLKTPLTLKERLFCVIAYMPKATAQPAIGSVPLSLGLPCGPIILSVAVLGIIITAPLGALGIDTTYKKLLKE